MATGGTIITLSTSYQTAFDVTTDLVAPCYGYSVRAVGNDVTVRVTYAGATATRVYEVASGSSLPLTAPLNTNGYRGIIKVEVKANSAAGSAYCNVLCTGEGA